MHQWILFCFNLTKSIRFRILFLLSFSHAVLADKTEQKASQKSSCENSSAHSFMLIQQKEDGPKLIFPVNENDTAKETLSLYAERLATELSHNRGGLLLEGQSSDLLLKNPRFEPLVPLNQETGRSRILVLANRLGHMLKGDAFPFVRERLQQLGATVHILPIRLDLITTKNHRGQIYRQLFKHYDSLIAIGGADVDPNLFGVARSFYLGRIFREVDAIELEILSEWLIQTQKPLFGICRGHQIIAGMLGAKIDQDIKDDQPSLTLHHAPARASHDQATLVESAWHKIDLVDQKNPLFTATQKTRFLVNSRHHQALNVSEFPDPFPQARIIAQHDDIVEALELKNERGFTVQFHPEDMDLEEGFQILKQMILMSRKNGDQLVTN